jgi:DNA-binding winged helix-turn-helix (wHTH) protein/TolB-like protein/Flp pilus assembly protein TadD
MPSAHRHFYEFGPFRLDADKHRLMRDGEIVPVSPKALETLLVMVQNPGKLLERDALIQAVWADTFVEDANLTVAISHLRKALGQTGEVAEFIETVPRAGYRFVADVRELRQEIPPLIVEKRTVSRTIIEEEEIYPEARPVTVSPPIALPERKNRLVTFKSAAAALAIVAVIAITAVLLIKFRQTSKAPAPVTVRSLAILPFKVVGSDANDHQGLGLADVLITRLSNFKELKVRPTSAVMAFEKSDDPIGAGKKLEVDAVLEGTIYRSNDRTRITARLLRVVDGSAIWNGQFERTATDELRIQQDIASQIADALTLVSNSSARDAVNKRYTENTDAYQLYLKGRYEWNKRNWGSIIEAERLFRNAIAKDPDFALAYVGLADVLVMNKTSSPQAIMAIQRALEIDPTLSEAYATRGFIETFHHWNWSSAEAAFKRSLELNPGYATAHHWYAQLLAIQGRHDEAKAEMRNALEINPLSHNFLADLGQIYYFNREYQSAEEHCRRALEIAPDFIFAHNYLFFLYLKTGQYEKALESKIAAHRVHSSFNTESAARRKEIEASLEGMRRTFREGGNECYVVATTYAFLGQKEKALSCLERAYQGQSFLSSFVKADPIFDDLRGDPRYQSIVSRMGL